MLTQVDSDVLQSVTSMCLVNNAIWVGDNEGYVRAYCSDTYQLIFSYNLMFYKTARPSISVNNLSA